MKTRYSLQWLLALLILFSLPALACGLTAGNTTEQPPVVEPEESSDGGQPSAVEEPDTGVEAPAFSDLKSAAANIENLDSYRLDMTISFEGTSDGEARSGTMRFQSATVAEPRASEVVVTFEGDLSEQVEGVQALTFTEIGDRSYTILPDLGCVTGAVDEMETMTGGFDDLVDTEEMLGEIQNAEYAGMETIEGVNTFHYRFDESNVNEGSNLDLVQGDVYIAQDGGYVVRLVADGKGAINLFDEETQASTIHLEYVTTDVNMPIEIAPPDECADAGSEYPVMPGATSLASMAGFTSYEVTVPLADVIAFYDTEMPALGFDSDEDSTVMEEFAMLGFTKEGTSVNVTLSEQDGVVSVLITSGEE